MADIEDVLSYLAAHCPDSRPLSDVDLGRLVYLSDWKSAISRARQMTKASWRIEAGEPVSDAVNRALSSTSDLRASRKRYWPWRSHPRDQRWNSPKWPSLTTEDEQTLQFVLGTFGAKSATEFTRLVYSTYPVFSSASAEVLELEDLAKQYEEGRHLLASQ